MRLSTLTLGYATLASRTTGVYGKTESMRTTAAPKRLLGTMTPEGGTTTTTRGDTQTMEPTISQDSTPTTTGGETQTMEPTISQDSTPTTTVGDTQTMVPAISHDNTSAITVGDTQTMAPPNITPTPEDSTETESNSDSGTDGLLFNAYAGAGAGVGAVVGILFSLMVYKCCCVNKIKKEAIDEELKTIRVVGRNLYESHKKDQKWLSDNSDIISMLQNMEVLDESLNLIVDAKGNPIYHNKA